jgi:hypothetical protein
MIARSYRSLFKVSVIVLSISIVFVNPMVSCASIKIDVGNLFEKIVKEVIKDNSPTDTPTTAGDSSSNNVPTQTAKGDIRKGNVAKSFESGDGTQNNPYLIKTSSQLMFLGQQVNSGKLNGYKGKYFQLISDIDLGGREWTPIGYYRYSYNESGKNEFYGFEGTFDGGGYTITRLNISKKKGSQDSSSCGLFGGSSGNIKDVHLTDFNISVSSFSEAGGLVGTNGGKITNCTASGNIYATVSSASVDKVSAGGLVGVNMGEIANCAASGNVTSFSPVVPVTAGGLVGMNEGKISNCVASTNADASSSSKSSDYLFSSVVAGGLVGENLGSINDSDATGNVSGSSVEFYIQLGGLVGESRYTGVITNCNASGSVTCKSSADAGGLVGSNYSAVIKNCTAKGRVTASEDRVGGLVGWNGNDNNAQPPIEAIVTDSAFSKSGTGQNWGIGYDWRASDIKNASSNIGVNPLP